MAEAGKCLQRTISSTCCSEKRQRGQVPACMFATQQIKLSRAPTKLVLNATKDGTSTSSLGNVCRCLTILSVKYFPLNSDLNCTPFSLKPLLLVLPLSDCVKSHSIFLISFLKYWKSARTYLWKLLFFRLNNPNSLSFFFIEEILQSFDHVYDPCLDLL